MYMVLFDGGNVRPLQMLSRHSSPLVHLHCVCEMSNEWNVCARESAGLYWDSVLSISLHLSVIRDALLFRMLLSLLLHYLPWLWVDDKSVHCLFCQTSNLLYSHLCHSAGISCLTATPAGQACGKRVKKTTERQHAHSRETTATLLTARPVAIATICLLRSTGMQGWQDGGGGGGGQGSALCFLLPSACLCGSF